MLEKIVAKTDLSLCVTFLEFGSFDPFSNKIMVVWI